MEKNWNPVETSNKALNVSFEECFKICFWLLFERCWFDLFNNLSFKWKLMAILYSKKTHNIKDRRVYMGRKEITREAALARIWLFTRGPCETIMPDLSTISTIFHKPDGGNVTRIFHMIVGETVLFDSRKTSLLPENSWIRDNCDAVFSLMYFRDKS